MIQVYGNRTAADGEVEVIIDAAKLRNERNRISGIRYTWTMRGLLTGATQAALTTAITALEAAYADDGGDLIFYLSDGTTQSAHVLRSNDCLGGTRVISGPKYPVGRDAEYSGGYGRSYEVVVEGDVMDSGENLSAWSQAFNQKGVAGAEKWVLVPTLNGPWPRQAVNEKMPIVITQHGTAVGTFRHPTPPPPRWPRDEHHEQRMIEYKDPDRKGSDLTNYQVNWTYVFETTSPRTYTVSVP